MIKKQKKRRTAFPYKTTVSGQAFRRPSFELLEDRRMLDGDMSREMFGSFLDRFSHQVFDVELAASDSVENGAARIPVIGKTVRELFGPQSSVAGPEHINRIFIDVSQAIQNLGRNVVEGSTTTFSQSTVQQLIFDAIGGLIGEMGPPSGDPNSIDARDILIEAFDPASGTIKLDMNFARTMSVGEHLDFNLGVPGFPFQINAGGVVGLTLSAEYRHFKVGLENGNLYFDTSPANELSIGLAAGFTSGGIEAQFGFLQVQARPGTSMTLSGNFTLDIGGPTLAQNPRLGFSANVHLPFETKPVSVVLDEFQMPRVRGELDMDWSIASTDPTLGVPQWGSATELPHIKLNNLEIQVGGLMQYIAGPMMRYLRYTMLPSQLFVKVVTFPIPGFSDIWQAAFHHDLTILEIANVLSDVGAIPPPYGYIVDAVNLIKDFTNSISTLTDDTLFSTDIFNAYFPVGSIDFTLLLNGIHDLRQDQPAWGDGRIDDWLADPAHVNTALTNLAPYANAVGKSIDRVLAENVPLSVQNNPAYQDKLSQFRAKLDHLNSSVNLSFPIIQDPAGSIFKLFTGQDFQFAQFTVRIDSQTFQRADPIDVHLEHVPIGLPFKFGGDMTMDVYLKLGFDSRGLRGFLRSGAFGAFEGFNIDYHDPDDPSKFRSLLNFNGTLTASMLAGLDFGVLSGGASLEGYIKADHVGVSFDDPNHDGYFRPFIELNDLTRLFKTEGKVAAGVQFGVYEEDVVTGRNYLFGPIRLVEVPMINLNSGSPEADPYNPYPALLAALKAQTIIIPKARISDATVMEKNEGQNVARFTVTLDIPAIQPLTIDYATLLGGTASADDIVPASGTLTFAEGDYQKVIEVPIVPDRRMERDETYMVLLSNPVGATLYDHYGLGTIIDEDTEALYTTPTGPYDLGLGGTGSVSTNIPDSIPGIGHTGRTVTGSMLDPDGRLVIFGSRNVTGSEDNALTAVRYLPNGQLDPTFASGGIGTYLFGEPNHTFTQAGGAVYQSGANRGKVLVFGNYRSAGFGYADDPRVIRLNVDGTLDHTFGPGGQGWIGIPLPGGDDIARNIAIYESGPNAGKFVVTSFNNAGRSFGMTFITRHNADGSLDPTFAYSGTQYLQLHYNDDPAGVDYTEVTSIVIDSQNRLVLAGQAGYPGTYSGTYLARSHAGAIVRLTANGTLDSTFGTNGVTFTPVLIADGGSGGLGQQIADIELLSDGKIVGVIAAGILVRFGSNGALEYISPPLSISGFSRSPAWNDIILDSANRVYATGGILPDGTNGGFLSTYLTTARFLPVGDSLVPDPTFDPAEHDGSIVTTALRGGVHLQFTPEGDLLSASQFVGLSERRGFAATEYETARNDLSVSMTTDTSSALSTGQIIYTIRVNNTGDDAAFASIKDLLPANTKIVSLTLPANWVTDAVPGVGGQLIATTRGLKASDGEQVFVLTVELGGNEPFSPTLANTVQTSSATLDTNNSNNSVTAVDTVAQNLSIEAFSSNIDQAATNAQVSFAFCVTNNGPYAARYQISTAVPTGSEFVSATGNYTLNGGTISWDAGTLAAGAVTRCDFVVRASAPAYLQASGTVTGRVVDQFPYDNTATSVTLATPSHLVSYWKADSQGSSGTIYDSVGNNHGTLAGGATLSPGYSGQAFQLDSAARQYVDIPDSSSLKTPSFTISARFTANSVHGISTLVSKTLGGAFLDSYSIWIQDGTLNAFVTGSGGWPIASLPLPPNFVLGAWYQAAITVSDAQSLTLYLFTPDGVQQASVNFPFHVVYDDHPFRIGMDIESGAPAYYWNGKIDEVYFFDEVLSQNQIASLDYSQQIDVPNGLPEITANNSSVIIGAGAVATNSGTISDPDGDTHCVFLSASQGTITQDANNPGHWSWTYDTTVAEPQHSVTVTINDGRGGITTTSFNLQTLDVADYDHSGVLGPEDMIFWRAHFGDTSGIGLNAAPNGDVVDARGYVLFRHRLSSGQDHGVGGSVAIDLARGTGDAIDATTQFRFETNLMPLSPPALISPEVEFDTESLQSIDQYFEFYREERSNPVSLRKPPVRSGLSSNEASRARVELTKGWKWDLPWRSAERTSAASFKESVEQEDNCTAVDELMSDIDTFADALIFI